MLVIILLIEDQQREPTKKPEAIASGFSLAPPAGLEPCDTVSLRSTASLLLFYKKANVAQRNKLRNHDVLLVRAEQKKRKTKESNRFVTLFCLAPPAGLEPATS